MHTPYSQGPRSVARAGSAVVFCLLTAAAAAIPECDRGNMCRTGMAALEAGQNDSAMNCFVRAYACGLPQDSLYYLWAEVCLRRGALDTALALNYAITPSSPASPFGRMVYTQRVAAYAALGWHDLAARTRDTLRAAAGREPTMSHGPQVRLALQAGYHYENEVHDTTTPWVPAGSLAEEGLQGIAYRADGRVTWRVPLGRATALSAGLGAQIEKPSWTGAQLAALDSASIVAGGRLGLEETNRRWSVVYGSRYRRYYDGHDQFGQTLDLSAGWGRRLAVLVTGGYGSELDSGTVRNQTAWAATYTWLPLPRQRQAALVVPVMGFWGESPAYAKSYSAPRVMYVDGAGGTAVTHYRDAAYTQPIVPSDYPTLQTYVDAVIAAADTAAMGFSKSMPQDQIILSPHVSYSRQFGQTLTARAAAGWRLNYYTQPYEWTSFSVPITEANLLAYNRSDGQYYVATDGPRVSGTMPQSVVEAYAGPAVAVSSERRVDNTLTVELSLAWRFRRAGTIEASTAFSRTWSSLAEYHAYDMAAWHWSATLGWSVEFGHGD